MPHAMINFFYRTKSAVTELNLFQNEATRTNPFHLRTALISTRLYLLSLTLGVIIFMSFISLRENTSYITVQDPSQLTYEQLYAKHSNNLQCPCYRISIPQSSFITILPEFHPVCTSYLVSDAWNDLLFSPNISLYSLIDFRSAASGQFQLLTALCSFARQFINDTIDEFLAENFMTGQVIASLSLEEQTKDRSDFARKSIAGEIERLLIIVKSTVIQNGMQTALQTSNTYRSQNVVNGTASVVYSGPVYAQNGYGCSCTAGTVCTVPSGFFSSFLYGYRLGIQLDGFPSLLDLFDPSLLMLADMPGFKAGCYPMQSLLESTLECFFDSKCSSSAMSFFSQSTNRTFQGLNSNETSFDVKAPIKTLFNDLFIEQWSTVISFPSYFKQCAPISCTYPVTQRNDPLYIWTKLLGLYGGLGAALRFIVPHAVAWWRGRAIRRTTSRQGNARKHTLNQVRLF